MTNRDIVLKTILNCGTMDLSILDDIGYDIGDIIDDLMEMGLAPTLNAITDGVFHKGVCDL